MNDTSDWRKRFLGPRKLPTAPLFFSVRDLAREWKTPVPQILNWGAQGFLEICILSGGRGIEWYVPNWNAFETETTDELVHLEEVETDDIDPVRVLRSDLLELTIKDRVEINEVRLGNGDQELRGRVTSERKRTITVDDLLVSQAARFVFERDHGPFPRKSAELVGEPQSDPAALLEQPGEGGTGPIGSENSSVAVEELADGHEKQCEIQIEPKVVSEVGAGGDTRIVARALICDGSDRPTWHDLDEQGYDDLVARADSYLIFADENNKTVTRGTGSKRKKKDGVQLSHFRMIYAAVQKRVGYFDPLEEGPAKDLLSGKQIFQRARQIFDINNKGVWTLFKKEIVDKHGVYQFSPEQGTSFALIFVLTA